MTTTIRYRRFLEGRKCHAFLIKRFNDSGDRIALAMNTERTCAVAREIDLTKAEDR